MAESAAASVAPTWAFATDGPRGITMPNSRRICGQITLPGAQPLTAQTMQRLQLLLLKGLDRYCANLRAACRFDQSGRIGPVGLAASDVRLHVVRGQKPHGMTLGDQAPRPVVGTAAGFHDHLTRCTVNEEPREARAVQPVPLNNAPLGIGHGELEDVLCQINRDSRRVHAWTPSGKASAVNAISAWHIDAVLPSRTSPSQHGGGRCDA